METDVNAEYGERIVRRLLTSSDRVEQDSSNFTSIERTVEGQLKSHSPAENLDSGQFSTVTRTRTSAGRIRLALFNPINAGLKRGPRLVLGPERLVSARRFGTTDDTAAREKSSMVAEIVKEELRGEAGAQFLRQVRRIVKREMGKYATRHEMNKSIE